MSLPGTGSKQAFGAVKVTPIWPDVQTPRPAASLAPKACPKACRKLCGPHFCSMKIAQDVRDCAQTHRIERAKDALTEGLR